MPAVEPDITPSLIRRLVTAQFPQWASLPIEAVACDGWDNRTFHLGRDMSVRLPSAVRYAAQVPKEHYWLPKLAPSLPLPIPVPLAMGVPALGYPWHWSIYRWLEGEAATIERIADLRQFALALAEFLVALQRIDPTGGPPPGPHNFYRGGPLGRLRCRDPPGHRRLRRRVGCRHGECGMGDGPKDGLAWLTRLVAWRRQRGKSTRHERTIERSHRLWVFGRRRPGM